MNKTILAVAIATLISGPALADHRGGSDVGGSFSSSSFSGYNSSFSVDKFSLDVSKGSEAYAGAGSSAAVGSQTFTFGGPGADVEASNGALVITGPVSGAEVDLGCGHCGDVDADAGTLSGGLAVTWGEVDIDGGRSHGRHGHDDGGFGVAGGSSFALGDAGSYAEAGQWNTFDMSIDTLDIDRSGREYEVNNVRWSIDNDNDHRGGRH